MSKWRQFALETGPSPAATVTVSGIPETALTAAGVQGGAAFRIPLLVPEGVPTGDGRVFSPMSLRARDLPLPLLWQVKTGNGHDGSVIVGRIDKLERVANGLGNAIGVFDNSPHAQEAERLVRGGFLRGVSADLDQFEGMSETVLPAAPSAVPGTLGGKRVEVLAEPAITVHRARVMAATLVPRPAFQECFIELSDAPSPDMDGEYMDTSAADETLVACAAVTASIPVSPPAGWFSDPRLTEPTPLTVQDDGRVFGHIAAWHVNHIGLPYGTRPPRSRTNYAYFHTGVVRTSDGTDVPVGQLTLAGGHAPLEASARAAVKHYDDTASAVADVHAGEDAYGIWVSGALRPSVTPEQVRVLRASSPSGDWRPINGRLEMVAVCQVNVPGFPMARARVASGQVTALVAAGASALASLRVDSVEQRLRALEAAIPQPPMSSRSSEELRALADAARSRVRSLSSATHTSPGEEYASPLAEITDVDDLRAAVLACKKAPGKDTEKAKSIIKRRARELSAVEEVPSEWLTLQDKRELAIGRVRSSSRGSVTSLTAAGSGLDLRKPSEFREELHPRNRRGKFRAIIARLRDQYGEEIGTRAAIAALSRDEIAEVNKGDNEAHQSVADTIEVIDKVKRDTLQPDAYETLRHGYSEYSDAMAHYIGPGVPDTRTYRFTDLEEGMQRMINDLLDRLKDKVTPETYRKMAGPITSLKEGSDYMSMSEIRDQLSGIFRTLMR